MAEPSDTIQVSTGEEEDEAELPVVRERAQAAWHLHGTVLPRKTNYPRVHPGGPSCSQGTQRLHDQGSPVRGGSGWEGRHQEERGPALTAGCQGGGSTEGKVNYPGWGPGHSD